MTSETGEPQKKRGILTTKEGVAKLSIFAVSVLIVMKVVASILTGSISIRADALHSIIDLSGVIIGFIGIRIAGRPPCEKHAFGHGKAENIAGFAISALIFVAAGIIVYKAVERLITGAVVELVMVGIYVTVAAIAINVFVAWRALRVSKSEDSVALEAAGLHMLADVWSSIAVLVGLILVRFTGLNILDPIVALVVAVVIARMAYFTMKKSFDGLMDTKLPEDEEEAIRSCIEEYSTQIAGFTELRTRKAGSQRYIQFQVAVPPNTSVYEAHMVCNQLEQDIGKRLQPASLTILIEPCTGDCDHCSAPCSLRKGDTLK